MRKIVRTPDFPVVKTSLGKLHGYLEDDVYHFNGIRYGTAERFKLPEMEKPWEGIRDAKSYGYISPLLPDAMQDQASVVHDPANAHNPMAAPFSSFEMPHVYWPMSEDCLYLNVWTKHIDRSAKRPVLVWLHGGGFGSGSSIELPSYNGHNFTDHGDVVFVNLNHRVNCIGFLDLSSFGERYKYSGIAGMADIILALRWVKDNIEFFGGDPDNVTVAGQSGGGGKAAALLQMPEADGLYHKIISQSGALKVNEFRSVKHMKEYWQELGRKTVQMAGLDGSTIDRIIDMPYEQLSAAALKAGLEYGRPGGMLLYEPSPVEGFYSGPYFISGFRKETADIPFMAGTVLGEFNFMHYLGNKDKISEQEKLSLLKKTFGENTDIILGLFKDIYPDKDILYALSVDSVFRLGTVDFLNARTDFLSDNGKKTLCWNYLFSNIVPYLGGITLYHCGDIPFAFRNVETENLLCTGSDLAEELQERVSEAWLSFMKTGDPSTDELQWKPYSRSCMNRMQLDEKCFITSADDTEMLKLMLTVNNPF